MYHITSDPNYTDTLNLNKQDSDRTLFFVAGTEGWSLMDKILLETPTAFELSVHEHGVYGWALERLWLQPKLYGGAVAT